MNLQKPNYVMAIPGNLDIGTVGLLSISTLGQIYANASIMNRGAISYTCNPGPTFSGTVTNQGGSIYLNGYRLFTLNGPGTGFAFNGGLVSVPNVNCDFNLLTDVSCDASSQHQAIFSGAGNIWLAAGSSTIRTFNLTDSATLPAGTSEMVVAPSFRQSGGTASLRKTGSGVLELTGINTYTGTNTIDAGTLLANSALATGYGSVIVTNTGTLGGTGIVLGAVSVYSGASLTPGLWASAGTLTVSNNVNLKTGSTFNVGLSGSGNGLLICSNLTLAGYVSPTPLPGYTMPYSGAWTIATVLGAGTIDKTGATTPPGYTLKVTGSNLILNKPSTGMTCFFK